MNSQIPNLNASAVRSILSRMAADKALDALRLWESEDVTLTTAARAPSVAGVISDQSRRGAITKVRFQVERDSGPESGWVLVSNCSKCNYWCIHCSAVLIEIGVQLGIDVYELITGRPADGLDTASRDFLAALSKTVDQPAQRTLAAPKRTEESEAGRRVMYGLTQALLTAVSIKLKKDGTRAKTGSVPMDWCNPVQMNHENTYRTYGYDPYYNRRQGPSFPDEDAALIRHLYAAGTELSQLDSLVLCKLKGADAFLEGLIQTGRVHWDNFDNPIALGEPKAVTAQWLSVADNEWILTNTDAEKNRLVLLDTPTPWYVNLDGMTAGRVTSTIGSAERFANSSSYRVSAEQLESLAKVLAERKLLDHLPPLPHLPLDDRGRLTPIPVLTLHRESASGKDTFYGAVQFNYDGHFLPPDHGREHLFMRDGGRVRFERDRDFEAARVSAIENITNEQIGPDGRLSSESLFAAREDEFDWLPVACFQADFADALRDAGWQIQFAPGFDHELLPNAAWDLSFHEQSSRGWYDVSLSVRFGDRVINLVNILQEGLSDRRFVEAIRIDDEKSADSDWFFRCEGGVLRVRLSQIRPLARLLIDISNMASIRDGSVRLSRFDIALLEHIGDSPEYVIHGAEEMLTLQSRLTQEPPALPADFLPGALLPLRPYQEFGVSWMRQRLALGLGVILGDEMAAGKTIQTISHVWGEVNANPDAPPSIIVVPPTLLTKWQEETAKFYPDLRIGVYHGQTRRSLESLRSENHAVLTTYGTFTSDIDAFLDHQWHIMALEEGHILRNAKALKTRACKQLDAKQKVILSGTPLQNRPDDLWSIADVITPGLLRDERWFRQTFVKEQGGGGMLANERLRMLGMIVAPYHLHRTNKEIGNQLPEVNRVYRYIDMGEEQKRIYEASRAAMNKDIRAKIAEAGLSKSQIIALVAITRLRQISCHPALVKSDSIPEDAPSAKLEFLVEMTEELVAEGKRILIVSQWTEMLDLIEPALKAVGTRVSRIDGKVSIKKRPDQIARFRSGLSDVLLATLDVGGEGLDLPEADAVVLYAPWWNPAKENQVIARLTRDDSKSSITAYFLVAKGTLEEGVIEIGKKKGEMIEAVMEGNATGSSGGLSMDDINKLFGDPE